MQRILLLYSIILLVTVSPTNTCFKTIYAALFQNKETKPKSIVTTSSNPLQSNESLLIYYMKHYNGEQLENFIQQSQFFTKIISIENRKSFEGHPKNMSVLDLAEKYNKSTELKNWLKKNGAKQTETYKNYVEELKFYGTINEHIEPYNP